MIWIERIERLKRNFWIIYLTKETYFMHNTEVILIMRLSIWWRLWFLLKRRAWRAHRGGGDGQQFRPLWMRECASCCSGRDGMIRWRSSRRCRWWMSSWLTLISWRYRSLGELIWGHGRCRLRKSHLFSFLGLLSWLGQRLLRE